MIQKLIDAYELEREMYRKCIDTDEEIEKGRAKWDSGLWIRYKVFEDTITLAPRVDAIDVVRCKDCKFNYANQIPSGDECQLCVELPISKDFYCAYGEKIDEVNDEEERTTKLP